ncbi:MAG TPA: hypothetical protein VHV57_15425 [Acidimicrobiales bacterium]|nr:hypothetical protein [Acidimicrobiales bacterium]
MAKTKVFICTKCKQAKCLAQIFEHSQTKVSLVGCQKICAGPVAGVVVDGRMEWFSRIDTPKRIAGLRMVARHRVRRTPKALERRRVVKRSGRKPR